MATTTNYSWDTPDDTDLVKDGALAIRDLGQDIDTSVYGLGQGVKNYARNTTASLTLTSTTETSLMTSASWTPVAGRLYEISIDIGYVQKTTSIGNIDIRLRKDNTSGTILYQTLYSAQPIGSVWQHSKTFLATSTQLGTTAFVPNVTIQSNNVGGCVVKNDTVAIGTILFKDIGPE
jgi:hypothetical protein